MTSVNGQGSRLGIKPPRPATFGEKAIRAAANDLAEHQIGLEEERKKLLNGLDRPGRAVEAWISLARAHFQASPTARVPVPAFRHVPSEIFFEAHIELINHRAVQMGRTHTKSPGWRWDALKGAPRPKFRTEHTRELERFFSALIKHVVKEIGQPVKLEAEWRQMFVEDRVPHSKKRLNKLEKDGALEIFKVLRAFLEGVMPPPDKRGLLEPYVSKPLRAPNLTLVLANDGEKAKYDAFVARSYAVMIYADWRKRSENINRVAPLVESVRDWIGQLGNVLWAERFDRALDGSMFTGSAVQGLQRQERARQRQEKAKKRRLM